MKGGKEMFEGITIGQVLAGIACVSLLAVVAGIYDSTSKQRKRREKREIARRWQARVKEDREIADNLRDYWKHLGNS
jgi:uncharacterized protein (DUF2062 family)